MLIKVKANVSLLKSTFCFPVGILLALRALRSAIRDKLKKKIDRIIVTLAMLA